MSSTTLIWDGDVSLPVGAPNNDGQEGVEIYGDFLYATDFIGSNIDIYNIDPTTGELAYNSSFGERGTGTGQFEEYSPVDMSFFTLADGSVKAYVPAAINQRIVVLDVDTNTGALSWDEANTQENGQDELATPYGIEINGNFLYATDYGGSDIDIYQIDRDTGSLSLISSFGSEGDGVDQFSKGSPVDISFLQIASGATKAYVPDAENQRIVVLDVDTQTGALSWDESLTLPNGLPDSTLQYGLEIYEDVLYVTDWGGNNIDLYDIDLETGAIAFSHSVGSPGSESNEFGTIVDLSFYTDEQGITRAYVPDSENQRIAVLQVAEAGISESDDGLLALSGVGQTQLTLSLSSNKLASMSEVLVIATDSEDGSIGGVSPDNANYLLAAQERAQVVFSVLDSISTPKDLTLERVVDVVGGSYLNFVVIEGGSLQDAIDNPSQVTVSVGSNILNRSASQLEMPEVEIGLRGNNIQLTAILGDTDQPIGSGLQDGSAESELIDLTAETGTLTAEFEAYREAAFASTVGFFAVESADGSVLGEGDVLLAPGDEGYAAAALNNRIDVGLSSSNNDTTKLSTTIEGGQMLASFMVVDGTVEEYFAAVQTAEAGDDLNIFFTHLGANTDGGDHVKLLGDNTFGFEDSIGGDQDFDDMVVKVSFV